MNYLASGYNKITGYFTRGTTQGENNIIVRESAKPKFSFLRVAQLHSLKTLCEYAIAICPEKKVAKTEVLLKENKVDIYLELQYIKVYHKIFNYTVDHIRKVYPDFFEDSKNVKMFIKDFNKSFDASRLIFEHKKIKTDYEILTKSETQKDTVSLKKIILTGLIILDYEKAIRHFLNKEEIYLEKVLEVFQDYYKNHRPSSMELITRPEIIDYARELKKHGLKRALIKTHLIDNRYYNKKIWFSSFRSPSKIPYRIIKHNETELFEKLIKKSRAIDIIHLEKYLKKAINLSLNNIIEIILNHTSRNPNKVDTEGLRFDITTNYFGKTLLDRATEKGNIRAVEMLLRYKGMKNPIPGEQVAQAAFDAVRNDHREILEMLLDHLLMIESTKGRGLRPLGKACLWATAKVQNKNELKRLIFKKLGIKASTRISASSSRLDGNTMLHQASLSEEVSGEYELLIKAGEDPMIINKAGYTPLLLAIKEGKMKNANKLFKLMEKRKEDGHLSTFFYSVKLGFYEGVQFFLTQRSFVDKWNVTNFITYALLDAKNFNKENSHAKIIELLEKAEKKQAESII